MIDPKKPPLTHRRCAGPCGRVLALTADNFAHRKGPGRYPWQPSYWRPMCRACQREELRRLRDSKRPEDNRRRVQRRREMREAIKVSQGMTEAAVRASRKALKAKTAAKAEARAKVKRALYRPYDPKRDRVKLRIKQSRQTTVGQRNVEFAATQPTTHSALPKALVTARPLSTDVQRRLPFGVRDEPY